MKHKQCAFYIIFLPNNDANNGKMMKMPMPSVDSVKVAVRVRPFSQVSDKCYMALLKS